MTERSTPLVSRRFTPKSRKYHSSDAFEKIGVPPRARTAEQTDARKKKMRGARELRVGWFCRRVVVIRYHH